MIERIKAFEILNRRWRGGVIPVDPRQIAEAEGVVVEPFPWNELAGASGWFRDDPAAGPRIFYNPSEAPARQRFTIAHELGHFALGHGSRPRDSAATFNVINFDPIEASANRFAAELLMPVDSVFSSMRSGNTLTQLASAFAVSEVAMKFRLRNLGLIS